MYRWWWTFCIFGQLLILLTHGLKWIIFHVPLEPVELWMSDVDLHYIYYVLVNSFTVPPCTSLYLLLFAFC